jgi:hypothetical protein
MSDEPFYSPNAKPPLPRVPRPGELLFEFVRPADRAWMSSELRFHGESYGWEAQFLERDNAAPLHRRGALRERRHPVDGSEQLFALQAVAAGREP